MSDFQASLASVQPSAKREGFATVPDVTWEDVGALQDIREELTMAILVITFGENCISLASSWTLMNLEVVFNSHIKMVLIH